MNPRHIIVVLLAFSLPAFSQAADHRKLEDGLPVRVQDAYPLEFRALEAQPHMRYEMRPDERQIFVLNGKLEWGAVRNGQLSLELPITYELGEAVRLPAVELGALYNFNVETVALPALSFGVDVELPTSQTIAETDISLKGVLTKGLGGNRFHLNYSYTFFGDPAPGLSANGWFLGLGVDRLLTVDLVGVANVWTERARQEGEQNLNALEAGVRWMVSPNRLIAFGGGVGFQGATEQPFVVITAGLQQSF